MYTLKEVKDIGSNTVEQVKEAVTGDKDL